MLQTDLDGETARRAATALELNRDILISAAWPDVQIPEWSRAEVYVMADAREFQRHFGDVTSVSVAGYIPRYFLQGAPEHWEARRSLEVAANSTLRHQLAFQLIKLIYPQGPRWFTHGLAMFLETAYLSTDGRAVVMGAVNDSAFANFRAHRFASLEMALGDGEVSAEQMPGLDGMTWLFVHWLINTQSRPFTRYRTELMRGTSAKAAFSLAFPAFDARAAERELFQYSKHGRYGELSVPLRSVAPVITERVLEPADLLVVRAHLATVVPWQEREGLSQQARETESRELVNRALALDPTNVGALWLDTWSPAPERLSRLRAATRAHPGDARAWELLGDLLAKSPGIKDKAEQEAAFRKAILLAPNNPETLNNLAWLLVVQGRAKEALPYAYRAVKRAPDSAGIQDTYAAVLFRLDNCSGALAAQQRAVELLTRTQREAAPDFAANLARYQTSCARRRPTPSR